MQTKLISILAAASFSATAIAADQTPPSAVPVAPTCTVNADATLKQSIAPIANLENVERIDEDETDGVTLVSMKNAGLTFWNLDTGGQFTPYPLDRDGASRLIERSPNNQLQVWLGPDGDLDLWNIKSGEKIANLSRYSRGTSPVTTFSPDSRYLAVGLPDGGIVEFSTQAGRKVIERSFSPLGVRELRFSDDSARLFALSTSNFVELDAATGNVILNSFEGNPTSGNWIVNRTGTRLLETESVRVLIDTNTGKVLNRGGGEGEWLARFSDDCHFVVAKEDRKTRIISDNHVIAEFDDLATNGPDYVGYFDVQFGPDGQSAIIRDSTGNAFLVRLKDAKTIASLGEFGTYMPPSYPAEVEGGPSVLYIIGSLIPSDSSAEFAFSPDGSRLVTRTKANVVTLWDARSGKKIRQIGPIGNGRFLRSPSNAWLITITEDGTADLWAMNDGRHGITLGKKLNAQDAIFTFVNGDHSVSENMIDYEVRLAGSKPLPVEERVIVSDGRISALWHIPSRTLLAKLEKTFEEFIGVTWTFAGTHIYAFKESPQGNELWDVPKNRRIAKFGDLAEIAGAQADDRVWFTQKSESKDTIVLSEAGTTERLLTCRHQQRSPGGRFVQTAGKLRLLTVDEEGRATLWRVGRR